MLTDPGPHAGGNLWAAAYVRLKPTAEIRQPVAFCLKNGNFACYIHMLRCSDVTDI